MSKSKHESASPATEWLKKHNVDFVEMSYNYVEHGGTAEASRQLGVDLARQTGRKSIAPCKPEQAQRNSGYMVGGTSPFGTRKVMPVYVESTIVDMPEIYINGGRRGFLVKIAGRVLVDALKAVPVHVAIEEGHK